MSATWTSTLHRALAGADRLDIHLVVDMPVEKYFEEDPNPAYTGVGPDAVFQRAAVFCIADAEKISDLLAHIRIADAESGGNCMCTGCPWLRFYRRGEEIASFTWHHGRALRWQDGPWPGDGALTQEAVAAIPAWFLAEGFPLLHMEREAYLAKEAGIAQWRRAWEEYERSVAGLSPAERAELEGYEP
jgi:hypothetical protein